ncbi:unnamed protein product [Rotaria sp. Silwood2]|nr:unnamed protein product [Rotaria sp. Silwood2]CAF4348765.1 unnamed protein product [Rotaria sp. Silwood2]
MKQQNRMGMWQKNLRMISQLLIVAILYMGVYIPSDIILFMSDYSENARFQAWTYAVKIRYLVHVKYLVIFGCPFVIFAGQTEMHERLRKAFRRPWRWHARKRTQVFPLTNSNLACTGKKIFTNS